jgi:hypothetical protein
VCHARATLTRAIWSSPKRPKVQKARMQDSPVKTIFTAIIEDDGLVHHDVCRHIFTVAVTDGTRVLRLQQQTASALFLK